MKNSFVKSFRTGVIKAENITFGITNPAACISSQNANIVIQSFLTNTYCAQEFFQCRCTLRPLPGGHLKF